jgi:hypothetical protein
VRFGSRGFGSENKDAKLNALSNFTCMTNETESRLQQSCYIFFHNTYPHLRGLFFKIKNEGTNRITGARDKATGLIAGVADFCLLLNGTAIFIEFKTEQGKQSPIQRNWEQTVEAAGYKYYIIRTLNEFKELCQTLDL